MTSKRDIAQRIAEAGKRARVEAEARQAAEKATETPEKPQAPELGGRKGPEPTRFGDWERNGIISDF
jgi:hypothetical protein